MSQNSESKEVTHRRALAEVAERLQAVNDVVHERLVTAWVEKEVSKRVDLLDKGFNKLRELKRELDKIKPPVVYTTDGTPVTGTFTKAEFEKLKKAREAVTKLENTLDKAFAGQDFDKLANLVTGKEPASESTDSE